MNASGRGQTAAYVAAALLLLIGGAYVLRGGGDARTAAAGGGVALDGAGGRAKLGAASAADPSPSPERAAGRPIFVHVAGAVRRPGIYRVRPGSRAATAVRRAGGLTARADLTTFNLAAPLRDAQQVIVPRRGAAGAAAGGGAAGVSGAAAATGKPGQPISLSSATTEQLDQVDGIGPKLAAAIIGYRNQKKGFKSVDELREVDGIGEKRFATLSKAVRP